MYDTTDRTSTIRPYVTLTMLRRLLAAVMLTTAALIALLALSGVAPPAAPERTHHAALIWKPLVLLGLTLLLLPRRWLPPWQNGASNRQDIGTHPWIASVLLGAMVAVIGLVPIGVLALVPPSVEKSAYKAWDYLDKRWIAALYLLAVGAAYAPGIMRRLLEIKSMTGHAGRMAGDERPLDSSQVREGSNTIGRLAAAICVGSILAVLYVMPLVRPALERPLDSHELVHLAGYQAMNQGATPFLEARTQYGPGQQIALYSIGHHLEFSVRGFRAAHLLVNLATIAVIFSVVLMAYGWRVGSVAIGVMLFISPLQATTFVGWGLLERWVGPFLVGALVPLVLWSARSQAAKTVHVALVGIACGALGWMSQENVSTSVLALLFTLSAAVICGRIAIGAAMLMAASFVGAAFGTMISLLAATVGTAHLGQGLALFRSGSGLVFSGITNTIWTEANTFWSIPREGRGPAYQLFGWRLSNFFSGWQAAYFLTPIALVGLTAAALYPWRRRRAHADDRGIGQLLGMLAAASSLQLLTVFRADPPHVIGTSMAVGAMITLSVVYLPRHLFERIRHRRLVAISLALGAFLIYPFASANTEFRFRDALLVQNTVDGVMAIRALGKDSAPSDSADVAIRRLGYRPDPSARCCRYNKLSYTELSQVMRDVHVAAAGRTVFVDSKRNYSAIGPVTSAVYFLADLRPGTSYLEPMMSIWTDADIDAVKRELLTRPPDCVLTGGSDFMFADFARASLGAYSTQRIPGSTGAMLYCRAATGAPAA